MDSSKTNLKASKAIPKLSVKAPALPSKASAGLDQLELENGTEYGDFIYNTKSLVGLSFERVIIDRALFQLVRCSALSLEKAKLTDIRFESCELSNSRFAEAKFARVEIVESKVTGMHITAADLADLMMQNCIGDHVQFHGSSFKRVLFQNCQLRGADFRFCNLEGVIFKDCDLEEAEFYEAKLAGADFRTSNIMGIKAHPADLKGAIIDSEQASLLGRHLAKLLEMEVKEG